MGQSAMHRHRWQHHGLRKLSNFCSSHQHQPEEALVGSTGVTGQGGFLPLGHLDFLSPG